MDVIHKVLTYAGLVIAFVSGLFASVQSTFWPAGPPHWVAVVVTALGVVSLVVAKALELFSPTVASARSAALASRAVALRAISPK